MKAILSLSIVLVSLISLLPQEAYSQGGTRTVTGFAFVDANGNGEFDEGEEILVGAEVFLLDAEGNVIATAVSGSDGNYSFPNIPFGDGYSILVRVDQNTFAESPPFSVVGGEGEISVALPVNEDTRFLATSPSGLGAVTAIKEYRDAQNDPGNPKNEGPVSPFAP